MQPTTPEASPGDGSAVVHRPCPYRARAWWGDRVVAESTAAMRVEEPGRPPLLCFPAADVRFELFRDEGRTASSPATGDARLWSIDPPATAGDHAATRDDAGPGGTSGAGSSDADADGGPAAAPVPGLGRSDWADGSGGSDREGPFADGRDVLRHFTDPSPACDRLRGMVAFDHDRARVELVDAGAGDAPRDVTMKRFPNWGDAADLIDILDVRPAGEGRYTTVTHDSGRRPVVEGSQMLGQAIVAAGRHAPGRRTVSAHMVFGRAADARLPLDIAFDEVGAGRTFTTLGVTVSQGGRRCATGTLLLDVTAPDVMRHAVEPPEVAGPYESEPFDMSVTGRDLRIVDGAYTGDPDAALGPPTLDTWVRFRDVPDDPYLHAGLLAQYTGHMPIAAAMRPHAGIGQDQAHRTLSTAINAIAISLHGEVRADRWMLYRHLSTFAGDGMTHAECRVHDEAGNLLASFSVDAMVRGFPKGTGKVDDRTAL